MRLILLALAFFMLASCSTLKNKITFASNSVVAHRGAWKAKGFPENSIASLKQAIALGYRGSEFDVRMTADDSLIINHDPHYNKLLIEKTTYAELEKFKLANGEKLPTLREYILAGIKNNKHTQLVCEIKPSDLGKEKAVEIVTKVVKLVAELKAQKYVGYISFDYDMLKTVHQINPNVSTQYLEANKTPDELKADGITGADYYFTVFKKNTDWIEMAKANGTTLNAWTVNDPEWMDFFITNKFDFITTNEPEMLLEHYNKSKKKSNFSKLIWSDDFNGSTLDTTKWDFDLGRGNDGWGNQEKQYYTSRLQNVKIENGLLKITAQKENYENASFTSARLKTQDKFQFTYGKVEVKAKLSSGGGAWPAIWMLGSNLKVAKWPQAGEIDIMENKGNEIDKIHSTLHYPEHFGAKGTTNTLLVKNPDLQYHIYSLEWTAAYIKTYVDGKLVAFFANSDEIPFNHDFFILLNLAIGGNFGGVVDPLLEKTTFEIDYVKVYQ